MPRQNSLARFIDTPENRSALHATKELLAALVRGKEPPANPLYIHGPTGTGKTCLVESLASELAALRRDMTIRTTSAAEVRATQPENICDSDVLILEDIQRLRPPAEEWLVAVLNERVRQGAATIVTATVGPRHLAYRGCRFSARLTSRLAAGLVVGLEPLQSTSRLHFLEEVAQRRQFAVNREILNWLAENLIGGGRQLVSAIAQLETIGKLRQQPLDLKTIAAHFRPQVEASRPTIERIARYVGAYFRIEPKQLQSRRRYRGILVPRQVGMYLTRQLTRLSLETIGAYFGGRDHTTVIHACRKVESALRDDAALSGAVRELQAELI